MLEGLRGILVHDHWASYFKVPGVLHAMCNIHHLRELEALAKIDGEDWARRMQQLLRRRSGRWTACGGGGWRLPRSLLERIERRYDELVREALAYHEGVGAVAGRPSRDGGAARSVGRDIIWRCG